MAIDQSIVDKSGFGTSVTATPPSIQQRRSEAFNKNTSASEGLSKLSEESRGIEAEREKTAKPVEDEMLGKAKEELPTIKEEKIPEYERPTMKPEDLKETFSALMVASMLVGATSRTPYNNAMTAMTGAMNGFMQKDQELVEQSMKEFDKNVTRIKENNASMRREMEDNWKKNQHDLKAYELEDSLIHARYDRLQGVNAAGQKSMSERVRQSENEMRQIDTLDERTERLKMEGDRMRQQWQIHKDNMSMGGSNGASPTTTEGMYKVAEKFGMTKEAFEKAVDVYATNQTLPANARAIKSLPLQIAIMNRTAEKYPDANVAINKEEFKGDAFAYKQNAAREAAVNRITGALTEIQPRVLELTKKINTTLGGEFGNKTMNELAAKYGDNDEITELKNLTFALSREYVAATMMPGSNAQMHTGHAEEAKEMANGNMPINKMTGAIKGINEDVAATEHALTAEGKRLLAKMKNIGGGKDRRAEDKTYASESEAEAAAASGTLKSGDRVTINGQSGTWQ